MSHSIALLSGYTGPPAHHAILSRSDFKIQAFEDYQGLFQCLCRENIDLFIVDHPAETDGLPVFLHTVRSQIKGSLLLGIVVTPLTRPDLAAPPVTAVLAPPVESDRFAAAVAGALHLPIRAQRRYLVRMQVKLKGGETKLEATAVTVNINAGGMLIESVRPLPAGKTYLWSFSGCKDLESLVVPGKILRLLPDPDPNKVPRYAIQFDPQAERERAILAKFLVET